MTTESPRILIAAASASDADMVRQLIRNPQTRIHTSMQSERLVADFRQQRPHVLVLAYRSLAAAEGHYQQLCRTPSDLASVPHQTLLLCESHEIERAFALCCERQFDDYVLFWPMVHDAFRLAMSVRLALRALENQGAIRTLNQIAIGSEKLASMDRDLDAQIARANLICDQAHSANRTAQAAVDGVLNDFADRMLSAGLGRSVADKDAVALKDAVSELGDHSLKPLIQQVDDAHKPIHAWVDRLKTELAEPLQAARSLSQLSDSLRPHVLVVDDDVMIRKMLLHIIGKTYCSVQGAASGEQATSMLHATRPDLILMDVQLPDVDGIEFTRQLKRDPEFKAIPVIMLTGHSEKQIIVASLAAGAADFIVKPVDRALLLKKIARHMGARNLP